MALIVHKEYQKDIRNRFGQLIECRVEGWFLFGWVRLYYRIIEHGRKVADSIGKRK